MDMNSFFYSIELTYYPTFFLCKAMFNRSDFKVVSTKVTGFAKSGLIRAIINIKKYNFEIFNLIYLENDWSCLLMFLHKSIANQCNSLYLLYTG